jgi:hypothetical protein
MTMVGRDSKVARCYFRDNHLIVVNAAGTVLATAHTDSQLKDVLKGYLRLDTRSAICEYVADGR